MEHKANINANNSFASFFTNEEIELSKVLLQLSYPVSLFEHKCNVLKVGWGSTKRRSIPPLEPINVTPICCQPPPLPRGSGEKPPKSSKPRRRRREHWLEKINKLTERRELLKREVGKVGAYYEKLKAINFELKARKQELKPTSIMDIPTDVDVSNEDKSQGFDLNVAKKILTKAMCAGVRNTKDYFPTNTPCYPLGIDG